MADYSVQSFVEEKIEFHYPLVDIEKKKVKGVVTIDDRMYLSASVDLTKGMIHVEKNNGEFHSDNQVEQQMIEEIKIMAEFIILNKLDGYGTTVLN